MFIEEDPTVISGRRDAVCGRYWIAEQEQGMEQILTELSRGKTPEGLKTSGEIFPTDIVPVLANARRGGVRPFAMRWGYSFPGGRPVINAKSETASEKPMFRDGMKQRRCLIPASNYYEWERTEGRKIRHAIRPEGGGMLYFAGIYHLEHHGDVVVPAFAILTREAADDIRFIHARMPVILPDSCALDWLNPENAASDMMGRAVTKMEHSIA